MNIGKKIRELRLRNNMTQEKLADLLGVTYQAVSKWETEVSSPDVSLIVPIARLFCVSTDTLFGMDGENSRRAEFDAACENYWQKDTEQMYAMAQQAVAEFPGDHRYLEWLATMEYYTAFDDDYRNGGDTAFFVSMLEKSQKHYDTVIAECTDAAVRQRAIYGIILTLKYLGRSGEARAYAGLLPEEQGCNRDMMLALCSEGEELMQVRQRIVFRKTRELLDALRNIWQFQYEKTGYVREAVAASLKLIGIMLSDRNYGGFYGDLYRLYLALAEINMADNEADNAVKNLAVAKEYAQKRDACTRDGEYRYTCMLFDRMDENLSGDLRPDNFISDWKDCVSRKVFAPLHGRGDFRNLCG